MRNVQKEKGSYSDENEDFNEYRMKSEMVQSTQREHCGSSDRKGIANKMKTVW